MKRHADCACNPVHVQATDVTWLRDLDDVQTAVVTLLGWSRRLTVEQYDAVVGIVGLIEEGRRKPLSVDLTASEGRDGVRGGSQGVPEAPEGAREVA